MQSSPTFISPTLNDTVCPYTNWHINVACTETEGVCFFVLRFRYKKQQSFLYLQFFPSAFLEVSLAQYCLQVLLTQQTQGTRPKPQLPWKCPTGKDLNFSIFPFSPDQADAIVSPANDTSIIKTWWGYYNTYKLQSFSSNGIKEAT